MELQTLFGMYILISSSSALISLVLQLTILYLIVVGDTEEDGATRSEM